ncbi:MAG: DUF3127 domain-containing protein [Sphingobacteriales bacterium]|nr:MAG: DUF3127 domain-containing protein [Sphingobacteriales bacterium]
MEIKGKITQVMPLVTGEGKNGVWKKQEYVLEVPNGNYAPKKVCFSIWGDKIEQSNVKENGEVTISFDLESREYNGRWYTDVRAWKVQRQSSDSSSYSAPQNYQPDYSQEPVSQSSSTIDDDLPF